MNYLTAENLLNSPITEDLNVILNIQKAIFLIPHPDDEALGCGGIIQKLMEDGKEVIMCFMTSGNASHPNSKKYPSPLLANLREKEAKKACHLLGIPASNVYFFRQPDSLLSLLNPEENKLFALQLQQLFKSFKPDALFLPWRRDPHPDHRATFKIGLRVLINSGLKLQVFEYPVWLWKNSNIRDWPLKNEIEIVHLDISPWIRKKMDAIFAHQSQTTDLIDDDPEGFILTPFLLEPFLTTHEYFFLNTMEFLKEDSMVSK